MTPKSKPRKSPKPKKSAAKTGGVAGWVPQYFFEDQLKGEAPLTYGTAKHLYSLATEMVAVQPWNYLYDSEIFLLKDPRSGEMNYCSVMGAAGEMFALHVYRGDESYRLFRKIAASEEVALEDFLAHQTGVVVEFVAAAELTRPDRDLLGCFGHPKGKGMMAPIFRALRPGYHRWYVTEPEAIVLAECMDAALTFCEKLLVAGDKSWWDKKDVYPLMVPAGDEPEPDYEIELIDAPRPPEALPQLPALDEAVMRRLIEQDYPLRSAIELDHSYTLAKLGGKNERPGCVRVGLAADAGSGFLYPPQLPEPGQPVGETLAATVLGAIESIRSLPKEVRVKRAEFKAMLDPLAERLGISVVVKKALPSLEMAQEHMLRMMEGRER